VPDRDVSAQRLQRRLVEDLRDQTHVLVDQHLVAVADRDARGLLAAVLQGVEAEVRELGDFFAGGPDAEDATGILGSAVLGVEIHGEPTISTRHVTRVYELPAAWCARQPVANRVSLRSGT
jgi:hypothetical protein